MRQVGLLMGIVLSMGIGPFPAAGAAPAREPSPPLHDHAGQGHASHDHAGHGSTDRPEADTPATQGFKAAHGRMMRDMAVPYTGDADVDFRLQMIPHHQGAIAMAQVALAHAKDPWTRQLAEAVIVEQQREVAEMQAWLAGRGVATPGGGEPLHIQRSDSFRSLGSEAGTRAEMRGQSWAPGAGIR